MQGFLTWLHMGGYANYVWLTYIIALALFTVHAYKCKKHKAQIYKKLQRYFRQQK